MSRVLFSSLLQPKLDVTKVDGRGNYWADLQSLVARHAACPVDWVIRYDTKSIRRERQYDKAEEVITYYLFAALSLTTDEFRQTQKLQTLFSRGFRSPCSVEEIVRHLAKQGWAGLRYEALISPTEDHRRAIEGNVASIPVAYLREIIIRKKPGVRFESPTQLDAFVGNQSALIEGGGDIGLGFEAKFTSDIDSHRPYSPHRNQLIRNIEVGNGRFAKFYFVLIAPRMYRERRSRFYVYKIEEYLGSEGVAALRRDSLVPPTADDAAGWQQRLGFLTWEDIVDTIYPAGQPAFDHEDAAALGVFLRERGLL
jgi:hypothetical protein